MTKRRPGNCHRGAFTLLELILVMAMLLIVLSVAAPSLARFFRGRTLDLEAKRFLALTRYGQSRAVAESVPMVLWIDTKQGAYGLVAESTYAGNDLKAASFTVANDLQCEVETPAISSPASRQMQTQIVPGVGNVPVIRFTPDGFIGETSPEGVMFRQRDDGVIWITQSRSRLNYEIQTNQFLRASR